jgi:predicted  nucleic acid-binding Zn-ribbon protein
MKIPERDYSTHAANAANIAVSSEEIKKLGAKMDEADKNITAMENILAKFKGGDIIYKTINTTVAGTPIQRRNANGTFSVISTVDTRTTQQEIPCSQPNPELAAIYDAAPALLDKACVACTIAIAELSEIVLLHPHFIDMFTSAVHPIISVDTHLNRTSSDCAPSLPPMIKCHDGISEKQPAIPPAHVTTITDVVDTSADIPRNVTDANTAQLATHDTIIIKLRESLAATAAQLSQTQTTIAELQASVQQLATEKAALTTAITKLQAEYDAMRAENCRMNAAATARITELITEKEAATARITELITEKEAATARITELITEKEAATAAITKLQTEYDTVSNLRTAEVGAFEIAIRTLTNKLETLHEKCDHQELSEPSMTTVTVVSDVALAQTLASAPAKAPKISRPLGRPPPIRLSSRDIKAAARAAARADTARAAARAAESANIWRKFLRR